MMDTTTVAAIVVASNVLMLWVGFALGDDAHHEVVEVDEEQAWRRHSDQACWVARP